jgi:hypothetical protein
MDADIPPPPPEARLIRSAREAMIPKLSIPAAADRIGISEEHWGNIERGHKSAGRGQPKIRVTADASLLAKMAAAVRVTADRMESAGQRPDAAEILRKDREERGGILAPAPDPAWHPEPVPGGHFSVLDVAAAEPFAAVLREQYDELRAAGIADPDGSLMFPAHDTVPAAAGFAAAWDAAMMYAPGPDEESRVTQVIWMTALYQARREARLNEQGNADSALTSAPSLPMQEVLPDSYRSRKQ